jgi:hypothetical protein
MIHNQLMLENEIKSHGKTVIANAYSMSIGELLTMYKDGELILRPAFQRFFRWQPEKKSRFMESLLLDIPIPPIFVAERDDSTWELIDGLQRVSTIFETMGELRNEQGDPIEALQLCKTRFLPSLEGMRWGKKESDNCLPEAIKIKIKRARLDINIVKSGSDQTVKYEIFSRLNSGEAATSQEVRNGMIIMKSPAFYNFMRSLAESENFLSTLTITDRALEEAYDMELIARLIIFSSRTIEHLSKMDELSSFLDNEILESCDNEPNFLDNIRDNIQKCFEYLSITTGENSFRSWNKESEKYQGPFLLPLFECVAVGLCRHLLKGRELPDATRFKEMHKDILNEMKEQDLVVKPGRRSTQRIPRSVEFGENWASRCDED